MDVAPMELLADSRRLVLVLVLAGGNDIWYGGAVFVRWLRDDIGE